MFFGPPTGQVAHMSSLQSLREKLQAASVDFQKIQTDLSKTVEARQRLDAQLSENELVKKEFASLASGNIIYKQIGPVLVKQDQADAKTTVDTRLEFIRGEIKRIETQLKDIETKSEKKKSQIVEIQTMIQQQSQPPE